jgi:hypothetical protein
MSGMEIVSSTPSILASLDFDELIFAGFSAISALKSTDR